jgi:nucleoside-diphosphate-sugar epimerase
MSEQNIKQSILVTGANGFIGSRLCELFVHAGYRVVAGVRKSSDLTFLKDLQVEYRFGDITQADTIPAMISGVDYIIHNAGLVKSTVKDTFFAVNARGTAQLMSGISNHNPGVKKVVLISSLAAAGPSPADRPLTENDPPHPVTVYGESKLAGEQEFLKYRDRFKLVILRPSGVYGPGDKEAFTFFQTAARGIRPYFGDTSRKLQLVHVDDLCRSVLCAIRRDVHSGEAYFVAEKIPYSLGELVALVSKASGRGSIPIFVPGPLFRLIAAVAEYSLKLVGSVPMLTREKANELLASWEISTEKAKRELGFESEIPFADGAKQTFAWYREHGWL